MTNSGNLKRRLRQSGYSDSAILAAWPSWWSEEAEGSISGRIELRFSLARKLGLDPRVLLERDEPIFVWEDEAKFKHLGSESEAERAALSSFGISVGRMVSAATKPTELSLSISAKEFRTAILSNKEFVGLQDLLGICWSHGIPVIHLRVFPLTAKRMCAMSVRIGDRFAILLGKDSNYPAPISFYLAHELGHIALGHLQNGSAVVDLADPLEATCEDDEEERAADRYALELLTGIEEPKIDTDTERFTARQLAANLLKTGRDIHIEPGVLALCFGYTTGNWAKANLAMKDIYVNKFPAWQSVNGVARSQLDWEMVPDDLMGFLRAVIGEPQDDDDGH